MTRRVRGCYRRVSVRRFRESFFPIPRGFHTPLRHGVSKGAKGLLNAFFRPVFRFPLRDGRDPLRHRRPRRGGLVYVYSKDLPDYTQLKNYEPPVMTRVHAGDGSILAEYAHERRLYLAVERDPAPGQTGLHLGRRQEFLHPSRRRSRGHRCAPALVLVQGSKHMQGASTITQQVAKNFLLTNERSFERKIKEALISHSASRQTYSKEQILELYLNEIYLGLGNYGVAAAALNYFDKSVHELTRRRDRLSRRAAEGPQQLQSVPQARRGDRRAATTSSSAWSRTAMSSKADGENAKAEPLGVNPRALSPNTYRRRLFRRRSAPRAVRPLRRQEAL